MMGEERRLSNDARVGIKSLRGSHRLLLASVLSTLARFVGSFLARETPISLTG
jgi:hypothetical protein